MSCVLCVVTFIVVCLCSVLSYLTLPYLVLPYLTLSYLTLPYLAVRRGVYEDGVQLRGQV